MFMKSLRIAAIAALPLLAAQGAMAASVTVMQQYPVKQSQAHVDQALTQQLKRQGFGDVSLSRAEDRITVSGVRQNEQLTLIYDAAKGQLIEVNGEPAMTQSMMHDAMLGRDAS